MKRIWNNTWILALLAGVLPALAWPPLPGFFLLFIALIPLFKLEDIHHRDRTRPGLFFIQVWLALLLWNVITTFWVWNASPEGSIAAFVINSLLFTLPWLTFHRFRRVYNDEIAYIGLISLWIAIEYLHFNWDLAWPWLALGNAFAAFPQLVQWYEYTGVLGGTLWVFAINLFIYLVLNSGIFKRLLWLTAWLGVPVVLSLLIWNQREKELFSVPGEPVSVAVVQPNIDPFSEKFGGKDPVAQVNEMIALSEQVCDSSTALVLWPETSITESLIEDNMSEYETYRRILEWKKKYPALDILTGANTFHFFASDEEPSVTARASRNTGQFFDAYNTALFIQNVNAYGIYHKSKLVPGVEKMPYPQVFGFLEGLAIDLGGSSGSYGRSDSAIVFRSGKNVMAPIICYESVFGEYVTEFVQKGANIICIITNDGWWKDTPGYKQHFHYARLRAIETRKYVTRSANTGVSGFIDPLGRIDQQTGWWVPAALVQTVYTNDIQTFYVKHGDYLGRIGALIGIFLFIAGFFKRKSRLLSLKG